MCVVVLALVGAGCSGSDDGDDAATDQSTAGDEAAAGTDVSPDGDGGDGGGAVVPAISTAAQLVSGGRSVIRTAELEVRVDDVAAAGRRAVVVAEAAGGFLADEQSELGDDPASTLVVKVPPERFTPVLDELAGLGEAVAKRVGSDDVTEVVVDLEGRLAAARASVDRLRELLAQAGDVAQIVSVESELARREGEVEALAGQLRSLESQVDLATITLQLDGADVSNPAASEDIPGFAAGLRTGWAAFVNVVGGAATVTGFLLPFIALAVPLGVMVWWHRRRDVSAA